MTSRFSVRSLFVKRALKRWITNETFCVDCILLMFFTLEMANAWKMRLQLMSFLDLWKNLRNDIHIKRYYKRCRFCVTLRCNSKHVHEVSLLFLVAESSWILSLLLIQLVKLACPVYLFITQIIYYVSVDWTNECFFNWFKVGVNDQGVCFYNWSTRVPKQCELLKFRQKLWNQRRFLQEKLTKNRQEKAVIVDNENL